jgi:hypothetical protein
MSQPIDYNLHGLAGIRVFDARLKDAAIVTRQLAPIQSSLDREPDIASSFRESPADFIVHALSGSG